MAHLHSLNLFQYFFDDLPSWGLTGAYVRLDTAGYLWAQDTYQKHGLALQHSHALTTVHPTPGLYCWAQAPSTKRDVEHVQTWAMKMLSAGAPFLRRKRGSWVCSALLILHSLFTQGVVMCWHRLHRKAVGDPSLEVFKARLVISTLWQSGWNWVGFKVPFYPRHSVTVRRKNSVNSV